LSHISVRSANTGATGYPARQHNYTILFEERELRVYNWECLPKPTPSHSRNWFLTKNI
jgi:hypothetical protein